MTERARLVIERIRSVPEGYVTTYGDVSPGSPRFAGAVLAHTEEDVPWHRVVRADGSLAKGADQRARLEAEGVPFNWRPRGPARGADPARGARPAQPCRLIAACSSALDIRDRPSIPSCWARS